MDSTLQTTTSSVTEQKYVNLRKRLDQLGYRQTLGIESLPLIEKLFNDLVHTTESLKKTKLDLSKNVDLMNTSLKSTSINGTTSSNGTNLNDAINAYKSDNAKLIKENNELHLQLIKIKDDYEIQIRGFIF
jgi:centrosomal protein CEP135